MEAAYNKQNNFSTVTLDGSTNDLGKSPRKKLYLYAAIIVVVIMVLVPLIVVPTVVTINKDAGTADASRDDNKNSRHFTLLVSLDGFRPDYLQRGVSPNLNKIAKKGIKADFMYSSFPSKTFPNHYTIVTGLYPESHGIVSNSFYDDKLNDKFSISGVKAKQSKWWGGEPIWVTAEKQQTKTASYYWVGSEAPIKGIQPTYWESYNGSIAWSTRIQSVVDWMLLPHDRRPYFIALYFEEPDKIAHKYGPDSAYTNQMIKKVDDSIGELLQKLQSHSLINNVNLIIISDHGMTNISCKREVYAENITNVEGIKYAERGALSMLYFENKTERQKQAFKDLKYSSKRLNVYSKDDITMPRRWHFTNNRRIGDIVMSAELQWSVLPTKPRSCYPNLGGHGFDNTDDDMKAVFFGMGPDLKENYSFDQLHNIEIYNLLAELLHVKAAPNNGTYGSLHHVLRDNFVKEKLPRLTYGDGDDVKLYNFTPRFFPKNYTAAYMNCTKCICPYCDRDVYKNRHYHMKTLNLTRDEVEASQKRHFPWGLPMSTTPTNNLLLTQDHYVHGYSTQLHLPLWAGYELTQEQLQVNLNRSNCFRRDIRLSADESSHCNSYYRSGYDRGHVANSGDFNFHKDSEQDTFMLSNMVPQSKYFNRYGSWRYSESMTRDLLDKYKKIYVISGSIFDEDNDGVKDPDSLKKRWLKNVTGSVAIPTHFYKILTRCKDDSILDISKCTDLDIATYILPHTDAEKSKISLTSKIEYIHKHVANVRDVERLTGLRFFTALPAPVQARIKTKIVKQI